MSAYPIVLSETCACGATTEALIPYESGGLAQQAHKALAAWRTEHHHEKPARQLVRIPLTRRRA